MRKALIIALNTIAMVLVAGLSFAAEGGVSAEAAPGAIIGLAMAIGMGIAAAGCGIGQGLGLKAACEGTARNPEASGKIQVMLILGLAFVESLAIYALVICLMLNGKVPSFAG